MTSKISNFTKHQHIIEECKENIISLEEITKLAKLARIKLSEKEKSEYAKELAQVINWLNKLNEVEIDEKKFTALNFTSITKKSLDQKGSEHHNVLENIKSEHNCFVVPKIIENG
ncbi:MAG: Asp-tRNA(Asn)/Glu-tRNA(Gln) amidotransferase subunit GatC [Rickettsiaceae bacterium H1]|nr:Asp-tRNA(Asn)/Glu-tRNA(Gln) amidotransferase subunit GatC [Rickettsiaceae bacterium H1]